MSCSFLNCTMTYSLRTILVHHQFAVSVYQMLPLSCRHYQCIFIWWICLVSISNLFVSVFVVYISLNSLKLIRLIIYGSFRFTPQLYIKHTLRHWNENLLKGTAIIASIFWTESNGIGMEYVALICNHLIFSDFGSIV